ncbi:hypothetical protein [Zarconia navalis]
MPTKPSRARRWLRDGKARIYSNSQSCEVHPNSISYSPFPIPGY